MKNSRTTIERSDWHPSNEKGKFADWCWIPTRQVIELKFFTLCYVCHCMKIQVKNNGNTDNLKLQYMYFTD